MQLQIHPVGVADDDFDIVRQNIGAELDDIQIVGVRVEFVFVDVIDAVAASINVGVVSQAAEQVLFSRTAIERIVAVFAIERIATCAANEVVVAAAAEQAVETVTAFKGVITGIAVQSVVVGFAADRVVVIATA